MKSLKTCVRVPEEEEEEERGNDGAGLGSKKRWPWSSNLLGWRLPLGKRARAPCSSQAQAHAQGIAKDLGHFRCKKMDVYDEESSLGCGKTRLIKMCFYRGSWFAGRYHGEGTLFQGENQGKEILYVGNFKSGKRHRRVFYTMKVGQCTKEIGTMMISGKALRSCLRQADLYRGRRVGNIPDRERYSIPMASRQSTGDKRTRGKGEVLFACGRPQI